MSQAAPRLPITTAMVLAAGLGKRMRPITDRIPKPLVQVGDRALIDHALDRLVKAGVDTAVVNVHYLAGQIRAHLRQRRRPTIIISDERGELLETGGGVKRALPLLGQRPFFVLNSDSLWIEHRKSNLALMQEAWDPHRMDILLLVASCAESVGYEGQGDFFMSASGRLNRRGDKETAPFIYAGVAILKPHLFNDTPDEAFSLNRLFDRAILVGRLYGLPLDGQWLHVGTPEAIVAAEKRLAVSMG
jgi:N-acetyl-alpha-D-muramate 1-phosphate uridylyltransferase